MAEPTLRPKEPQTGARKVTVACNIPNGITLRVCEPHEYMEPVLGGGSRAVKEYGEVGRVTLKGNAVPMRHDPDFAYPVLDKNGFALTVVDAELWETWIKGQMNKKGEDTHPALINGCIYAVQDPDKAGDKSHRDIRSNLHPLDMNGATDPRMPRSRPGVTAGPGTRAA